MGPGFRQNGSRSVRLNANRALHTFIKNPVCKAAAQALFVPSCMICGASLEHNDPLLGLCDMCSAEVQICGEQVCDRCGTPLWADSCSCGPMIHFETARSVFVWTGAVQDLVLKLKYGRRWDVANLMGDMMAATWYAADLPMPDIVVPVPIGARRYLSRGYNQSVLLARATARRMQCRFEDRFLLRTNVKGVPTSTKGSDRRQRFEIAGKSFKSVSSGKNGPDGLNILLADDVMTTGATASACADCLKNCGAARVDVITFARAIMR